MKPFITIFEVLQSKVDRSRPSEVFLGNEVFEKYAANLQENAHVEVWFQ